MLRVLLDVLAEVGSDHALIGEIAVGHHARPRAALDVELLVPRRRIGGITEALASRGYVIRPHMHLVRVYAAGSDPARDDSIADLVEREASPTLLEAARSTEIATVLGHEVCVVQRGALVALKFQAAVSPTRSVLDRQQDVIDMGRVIGRSWSDADEELALRLADTMFAGARDELARMIGDHRAGRPVRI